MELVVQPIRRRRDHAYAKIWGEVINISFDDSDDSSTSSETPSLDSDDDHMDSDDDQHAMDAAGQQPIAHSFIPLSPQAPHTPPSTHGLFVPIASPDGHLLPPLLPQTQYILPLVDLDPPAQDEGVILEAIQPISPLYSESASEPASPDSFFPQVSPQAVHANIVQAPTLLWAPVFPDSVVQPTAQPVLQLAQATLSQSSPLIDYVDGGRLSNAMAIPLITTHVMEPWGHVFLHSWNFVFHVSHVSFPAPNLVRCSNQALRSAYMRWDATHPNFPLFPALITVDNQHLEARRRTNDSPPDVIPHISNFETAFKMIIRKARQANMNRLLQCTLGALVLSQIIPFLPPPHVDIRIHQSAHDLMFPRVYTQDQKLFLTGSVTWHAGFGCRIWHRSDGDQIFWFANPSVQAFLAILLAPDEDSTYTLGVRRARMGLRDEVLSWGPVAELDNASVLALLAKILSSLSVSIVYDVVQQERTLPFHESDAQRNSLINKLTEPTLALLLALDDPTVEYSQLTAAAREAGRVGLLGLKTFLGFA